MADYESLNDKLITRFVSPKKLLIDKYYQNMLFVSSGILFLLQKLFCSKLIYRHHRVMMKLGAQKSFIEKKAEREFLRYTDTAQTSNGN